MDSLGELNFLRELLQLPAHVGSSGRVAFLQAQSSESAKDICRACVEYTASVDGDPSSPAVLLSSGVDMD